MDKNNKSPINEKIRRNYAKTLKELEELENDTKQIVNSQFDELTKKSIENDYDIDNLKTAMSEESKAIKEAGDYFFGLHRKCKEISDEIDTRINEVNSREHKHKNNRFFKNKTTNAMIDYTEKQSNHFASGNTFFKLFWVFFISCFAGVVIETIWCIVTRGHYESRVGLIWGPFNLVYGFGALFLTYFLYPYRNRSPWLSFAGGFIVGSVVEYACSLFQEICFGSTSWDYSNVPFNLNGRICLLYSIFWGILGIIWIKVIYPKMAELILKIPNRFGKNLTYILCVFMLVNSLMSGFVVYRWTERLDNLAPSNFMERWADNHYPNERLEKIYANLEFVENK